MNSVDLKFFQAVVRANSIGGAASVLHTVQSNVTARIKSLEEEIGAPLFHRSRRGVTLTATGIQLVPYADRVGELLDEAKRVVTDRSTPSGLLRIGSMETTAALRLPPILIRYAEDYPEVDVLVEAAPTEQLVSEVVARKLDGAFVSGPIAHPELQSLPIIEEELVVISSPGIREFSDLKALAASPALKVLAFRSGCSYRRRMDTFLAACGVTNIRWMELGTMDGIIGCVAAGVGVAMLPRGVVQAAAADGQVIIHQLPDNLRLATTVFVTRSDEYLSAALQAFMTVASEAHSRPQSAGPEPVRYLQQA
ncbi:LysR family transcriptional regulator [Agrobacterium rhizogenes]|jgi:DNA-binding transcriptional LysR family regulator|nr:LysR family transcriptional regulator [Rhizobium rhizogenes]NTH61817.1 LysR family transcriptional regulator [Rhizobium rhizogenes]NTH93443.1 LysR family transcriptional regulator [Rhizobium rhizogenes]